MDYLHGRLSLNVLRGVLLVFLFVQALFFVGYVTFERTRIEEDAVRVLRNTALLGALQFETSLHAMRYQMRDVGNALLLNRTVPVQDAEPFLAHELQKDWLDAVIVVDSAGDFVATSSQFPLEQGIDASTLKRATFRDSTLFKDLRREEVNERLFVWPGNGSDPNFTGFVMYRAIRDRDGRYIGGALGFLTAATIEKLFAKMESRGFNLGTGGVMAVMNRDDGIQLARMGAETQVTRLSTKAPDLMDLATDSAQAHYYVSPIDGEQRLGVFLNLNGRRWVLAAGLAERDLFRDWYLQSGLVTLAFLFMASLQWLLLHYAHANFQQRERLAHEARRDALTNLANRRHFNEFARGACYLAHRHQQPLSVLSLDLDFFKQINDTYGHAAGDAVLCRVAQTLGSLLRTGDLAARFGGEEFVVALPQTDLDVASQVAERIRATLAAQEVQFEGEFIHFTASLGVALVSAEELNISDGIHSALGRADHALYQSKREGRNRVTVAPDVSQF